MVLKVMDMLNRVYRFCILRVYPAVFFLWYKLMRHTLTL